MTATTSQPKAAPVAPTDPPVASPVPQQPTGKRVKVAGDLPLGVKTESGFIADLYVPWVSLPSLNALGKFVRVMNPATGESTIAWVAAVGPWESLDDEYVFGASRPRAESGKDSRGRKTDKSGIVLGVAVRKAVGLIDTTEVEWMFVS